MSTRGLFMARIIVARVTRAHKFEVSRNNEATTKTRRREGSREGIHELLRGRSSRSSCHRGSIVLRVRAETDAGKFLVATRKNIDEDFLHAYIDHLKGGD